jgi:VPDSG-CTERM motif
MKTKTLIAAGLFLFSLTTSRADEIVPYDFDFNHWIEHVSMQQFQLAKWDSTTNEVTYYGYISSGIAADVAGNVSWDIASDIFSVNWILVSGNGIKVYQVRAHSTKDGFGTVTALNGPIGEITFFGRNALLTPDSGSTVMLLGLALGTLAMVRLTTNERKHER